MASTGAQYPTGYSSGGIFSTNPTYAYADGTDYAQCAASTSRNQNASSYYTGMDMSSIPDGSTITQIYVEANCQISASSITGAGLGVRAYHTGTTAIGTEATVSTTTVSTDYAVSQTVTTGLPTAAQVKTVGDSGFRLCVRVFTGNTPTSRYWLLDYVRVTVEYTPPAGTGGHFFGSVSSVWW